MSELTADTFTDWLVPSDAVDWFIHMGQGEEAAKARVIAMLCDGLLVAAAGQLIVNGKDKGLTVIPREVWPAAAHTSVWSTSDFRFSGTRDDGRSWSISAYDVRIDRDIRATPDPVTATRAPEPLTPPVEPQGRRPGRRAGTNGEPIARVARRLLALPAGELAAYKVEALTSELVAEYRTLGLPVPHEDNARRNARGILRALREGG